MDHIEPIPTNYHGSVKTHLVVSFRYCFAFYFKFHSNQALSLGVLGPSLMDLGIQVGSTAEELSSVFVVRGVLAIAGSLIGPGLDRINLYLVIVFSLLVDAVLHGVVPWLTSLTGVLCTLGPPELFNCAIGMATHLLCVQIWNDQAGPYLQLLNLVGVLGFFAAPLVVSPFITSNHDNNNGTNSSNTNVIETKVSTAYLLVSSYSLVTAIFVMIAFFASKMRNEALDTKRENETVEEPSRGFTIKASCLLFTFNILYGGIEVGFPGTVMPFAVEFMHWEKQHATHLITVLQGSNALVTILAIFFSKVVKPEIILMCDVAIVTGSMILLVASVQIHPSMLWVGTALLGIGCATVMPCTFAWATSFMNVSGSFSAVYWCGYFTGFMVIPALTEYLAKLLMHDMMFVYVMTSCAVGMCIILAFLLWIVWRHRKTPEAMV
ncbi:hypothetical protein CAPTEDRAFT_194483 [Capitella teleta]|uniref:Major facilitator superfamily (MFS) profile domain-containing protein n=1 Tax=Capitella teleta TaxID=283909 RepID=R7T6F7_CAPTE|nr:hypothetical protein CAPTEDRAFT_194483 [Capitella teleta]|eukprot:ELT89144.1 hypothetical protein CAPTEDRAFT_194483 [Capitella teleta]